MPNVLNAIYLATVQTTNVRYRQHPAAAVGVALADDAAWVQVIASTVLTTVAWDSELNIGGPAAGITADTEEVIAFGTGGADGAAVAAATLTIEHEVIAIINTAVGEYPWPPIVLAVPIRVAASTRRAARISTSITGGMAVSCGFTVISGLGT